MKTVLAFLVVAIVAIGAGMGSALLYHQYEVSNTEEIFYDGQWVVSDASTLSPLAIVVSHSFDFGVIDPTKDYQHDFLVESQGTLELQLSYVGDDLAPLSIDLADAVIKVDIGSTFPITIRFKGSDIKEDFETEIKIKTNEADGKQLILKVSGQLPKN